MAVPLGNCLLTLTLPEGYVTDGPLTIPVVGEAPVQVNVQVRAEEVILYLPKAQTPGTE